MKEFLIGLIFIVAVLMAAGVGLLLLPFIYPILIILNWFLRLFIIIAMAILGIWLLGKFIVSIWELMLGKK